MIRRKRASGASGRHVMSRLRSRREAPREAAYCDSGHDPYAGIRFDGHLEYKAGQKRGSNSEGAKPERLPQLRFDFARQSPDPFTQRDADALPRRRRHPARQRGGHQRRERHGNPTESPHAERSGEIDSRLSALI